MRLHYILLGLLVTLSSSPAASTNDLPKFSEVYNLLRTNLAGVSDSDLDQAAVRGILSQLDSRVKLDASADEPTSHTPPLSKTDIFEDRFEYFRFNNISGNAAERLASSHKQITATNKIKGVVLDLRFADGRGYAAAAFVADLFIKTDQPLLDWGSGSARSTTKTNAISVPVAILVNSKTSGAAEALAAVLREAHIGLLVGSTTAGEASVFKEFPVSTGGKLRIATTQIKVGDNKVLSKGLVPDIAVRASLEEETAFLADPYKITARAAAETNLVANAPTNKPRRFNEAELVRQQREGTDPENDNRLRPLPNPKQTVLDEPSRPVITDPALARAIDLLKALAVVQQGRAD